MTRVLSLALVLALALAADPARAGREIPTGPPPPSAPSTLGPQTVELTQRAIPRVFRGIYRLSVRVGDRTSVRYLRLPEAPRDARILEPRAGKTLVEVAAPFRVDLQSGSPELTFGGAIRGRYDVRFLPLREGAPGIVVQVTQTERDLIWTGKIGARLLEATEADALLGLSERHLRIRYLECRLRREPQEGGLVATLARAVPGLERWTRFRLSPTDLGRQLGVRGDQLNADRDRIAYVRALLTEGQAPRVAFDLAALR